MEYLSCMTNLRAILIQHHFTRFAFTDILLHLHNYIVVLSKINITLRSDLYVIYLIVMKAGIQKILFSPYEIVLINPYHTNRL